MVLQHNSPYSAPCEGVAPSRSFRRQTFISATPAMKRRLITPPKILSAGTPTFLVLTALRHSGRAFTAHVAESAKVSMGLCPIPYARVLHPRAPCGGGVLYPHTPKLLLYSSFMHPFCQGTAPKNFAGTPAKIFAPLTTMTNHNKYTRGAVSRPAP